MKVEVEGKEGFIENSFGDRAIIPKDKWGEVQKMIDEGCYDCIDRFVANLPKYSDYAATGSIIPSDQRSPSGGSEVPEVGESVLERLKTSQTHEMTRSNYPKYDEQAINRQLEFHEDLQYAEETGIEDDFRRKWGTSVHKWKYDHDPEYKASHTLSPQEQKILDERHGTIGFPITDVRRSAPPNSQWMYPQLQGEAQAKQARISNEIIQAGVPIPGLNKIGKIPGLLDEALGLAGKALPNSTTTIASSVDDVNGITRTVSKDRTFFKDVDDAVFVPYNKKTNKPIQDEFIEEINIYMQSNAFKQKMSTYYPDVDIDNYISVVDNNLNRSRIRGANPGEKGLEGASGWYKTRDNIPSGTTIMPGYKTTFRQRVNLAKEEISKPSINSFGEMGESVTKSINNTVEHELSHQKVNGHWLLPDYLTKEYLEQNVKPNILTDDWMKETGQYNFKNYYSNPEEFDARIAGLKRDLKDQGIIDFTKSNDFTVEHLQKLDTGPVIEKVDIESELNKLHREFRSKIIDEDQYNKLVKHYEQSKNMVRATGSKVTGDTKDLLHYFTEEFLVEQMKRLPSIVIPTTIGINTFQQTENKNKQ